MCAALFTAPIPTPTGVGSCGRVPAAVLTMSRTFMVWSEIAGIGCGGLLLATGGLTGGVSLVCGGVGFAVCCGGVGFAVSIGGVGFVVCTCAFVSFGVGVAVGPFAACMIRCCASCE